MPIEEVRFRDYLDESGDNQIQAALDALDPATRIKVRAKLTTRLQYLADPMAWSPPQAKKLEGGGVEIWEIRFEVLGVQYRPLVWRGPGRVATLLMMANEKNDRFVPPGAIETAKARRKLVESETIKRTDEHDYS
jgi:hypothetical protein